MCTAAPLVFRTVIGNVSCLPGCVDSSYFAGETSTEISAEDGTVSASPKAAQTARIVRKRERRIMCILGDSVRRDESATVALAGDQREGDDAREVVARGGSRAHAEAHVRAEEVPARRRLRATAGIELVTAG